VKPGERTLRLFGWALLVLLASWWSTTSAMGAVQPASISHDAAAYTYGAAAYAYDAPAPLSTLSAAPTDPRGSPVGPVAISGRTSASVVGCCTAANTGPVLGPARSTDLVLDSFRGLGAGRNAHVRTVGSVEELQGTFNSWTVGAERLAPRGPNVPDVYRLPDGGVVQWRTISRTGGPSIDIITPSGRPRTVHLADGVTW